MVFTLKRISRKKALVLVSLLIGAFSRGAASLEPKPQRGDGDHKQARAETCPQPQYFDAAHQTIDSLPVLPQFKP
jgi:hypothetical protein